MSSYLPPRGAAGDAHPIRNGLIVTVVGGLLIPLILSLVGKLGAAWTWFLGVPATVWGGLTRSVAVPVWILIPLCLAALVTVARILIQRFLPPLETEPVTSDAVEPPQVAVQAPVSDGDKLASLDQLERKIFYCLARADGASLGLENFQMTVQATRLRIGKALEHLEELGFVRAHPNIMHGTQYGLTREGRDLLLQQGIV
jgi:hypothetical protein